MLLLAIRIFILLHIILFVVFQMFFIAANTTSCFVDHCLNYSLFVSICCHFGSHVCEVCYLFDVLFSKYDRLCCLTVVSLCFGVVFVDKKTHFC